MSKHTPGPWKYRDIDGSIGGIDTINDDPIGQAFQLKPARTKEDLQERIANACLMAAAPEMFSLLKEIANRENAVAYSSAIEGASYKFDLKEWMEKVLAVIEKATQSPNNNTSE